MLLFFSPSRVLFFLSSTFRYANATFNEITAAGLWSSNPWINLGFGGQGLGIGPQLNQSWIGQPSQYSIYAFWSLDYYGINSNVSVLNAQTGSSVQVPGTTPISVHFSTVTPSGVVWISNGPVIYALDPVNVSNSQLLCSNAPYNTTCCSGASPSVFHAIDDHVLLTSVGWTYFNVTSCSVISINGYYSNWDVGQPWNGNSLESPCMATGGFGIVSGDFAYCWQGQLPVLGYSHPLVRKRIYPPYDESFVSATYFLSNTGYYGSPYSWFPFCSMGRAWPVMYVGGTGVSPPFAEMDPESGKYYPSVMTTINSTTLASFGFIWSMSDTKYCRFPDYKTSVYGATDHGHRGIYNVRGWLPLFIFFLKILTNSFHRLASSQWTA